MLLAAGASTKVKNARGRTAAELALEASAPDRVVAALRSDGDSLDRFISDFASIAHNLGFISEKL